MFELSTSNIKVHVFTIFAFTFLKLFFDVLTIIHYLTINIAFKPYKINILVNKSLLPFDSLLFLEKLHFITYTIYMLYCLL